MGLFSKTPAEREHANAKEALEEVSKRDRTESDDYLAANNRVAAAERHVPWWKR